MTAAPPGLHDRPVLVIDPGMHTAPIKRADVDRGGRFAVTASDDKTVRVWSLADGALLRTIRLPAGPGSIGKAYAVAISPDGATIAAGGWTRWTEADPQQQIYFFDRASGAMTGRVDGLPSMVNDLAFSPDGNRLAAALGSGAGLRLYAREGRCWTELAADACYGNSSYGVAFAADGRLATTSLDGFLRLYDPDGRLMLSDTPCPEPSGLAFSPVNGLLAVGSDNSPDVMFYDGTTLEPLPPPEVNCIDNGNLTAVGWSADGRILFAAGSYENAGGSPVVAWGCVGAGWPQTCPAGVDTVMSLQPLADGALLVAAADPWLGVIAADGTPRWTHPPKQIDPRRQMSNFAVSANGMLVEFGLCFGGAKDRLRFDVAALKMLPATADGRVAPPIQDSLPIDRWINATPTLGGAPLMLDPDEITRSLAIHPDGARFLLGAEWSLRSFDAAGAMLWRRPVPGVAWAVNVSGDGRLAVAAYGDGTIRWHRMADGAELLALFPMPDGQNWVVWTPEGVYAASPGARSVLRWHVNRGWDAAADAIPVSAIPETHRPDVIPHVLPLLDGAEAIKVAQLQIIRDAIQRETGSDVPPGAQLHVLAIGVSDYGSAARHLNLSHAHRDARDLAAALRNSQGSLYVHVLVSELVDGEATKALILDELGAIREAMRKGGGADLTIILFSGHGEMVDGKFYLLLHGVDSRGIASLKATALSISDFHDEIAAIAGHGRVILFLDACRSGAATVPGDRSLRAMLKAPNVTIFTSSSAGEVSVESDRWRNGAFTEALLEALRHGDPDRDGLVCVGDLSSYLTRRVPELTRGRQRPDVEVRFDGRILVATG